MSPNSTAIVGGQFKGMKLRTGKDNRIRPTISRVREAIFNLLPELSGTDVLDLFAGAGTLGFEALSRGAASVTFVERNKKAVKLLETNRARFGNGRVSIVQDDCLRFLQRAGATYDVILADPPYGWADLPGLKEGALKRLRPGGTLVMETSARQSWSNGNSLMKTYGDTRVIIIRKVS